MDACGSRDRGENPRERRAWVAALRAIITDPTSRRSVRLFDEVNALAQTQPERIPGFGRESVHDWLPQFTELVRPTSTDDAHMISADIKQLLAS